MELGGNDDEGGEMCRDLFSLGSVDKLGCSVDGAANEVEEVPKSKTNLVAGAGDIVFSADAVSNIGLAPREPGADSSLDFLESEALFRGAIFLSGTLAAIDEKGLFAPFASVSILPKIDAPSGPKKGFAVIGPSELSGAAAGTAGKLVAIPGSWNREAPSGGETTTLGFSFSFWAGTTGTACAVGPA